MHWLRRGGLTSSKELRNKSGDDRGFSIVEMTIAMAILAVTAAFFAAELGVNMKIYSQTRDRTLAEEIATGQIEKARDLIYDDVGTNPGNPVGVLPRSTTVTVDGRAFVMSTRVRFVNDPVPGRTATRTNYKQVRVTISRAGKTWADMQTFIAPKTQSSLTRGIISVLVADYAANTPIASADVTVSGGPNPVVTDTTDVTGVLDFAGLLPTAATGAQSHYVITAVAPGYLTLPEDRPNALAVYPTLAATQTFQTTVRLFKPVTINATLLNPDGTTFAYPATLTVTSVRGTGTVPATGGAATFSQVGTNDLIPAVGYTVTASAAIPDGTTLTSLPVSMTIPANYPTVLTSDFVLQMPAITPKPTTVVTKDNLGNPVPGVTVNITGGTPGINLSAITDVAGKVIFPTLPSTVPYTVTVPVGGVVTTPLTQTVNVTTAPVLLNLAVSLIPSVDLVFTNEAGLPAVGVTATVTRGDLTVNIPITTNVAAGPRIFPITLRV
jgi:prepilin-type N-terminal cleavage/methylation domain-containing protein